MASATDIIRRLTTEVFLGGDATLIDELVSDDFVSHDPPPGVPGNKDGFRQLVAAVTAGFSDRRMEYDTFVETVDGRVVEDWVMLAVHTGEAFGLPPSGQEGRVRGTEIFRCADGQLVEHWGTVDMSDVVMKALGAGG
jgi:predicted ester cyclase